MSAEELNPQQRAAVEAGDGPCLVLAGAGSGKTRVIAHRIGHLLTTGRAGTEEILALTFTNKAAREMRERVEGLLGERARGLWVSTFHSACARILRREAPRAGLPASFTILSRGECLRLLRGCMERAAVNPELFPAASLLGAISEAKLSLKPPREVFAGALPFSAEGKALTLYPSYERALRAGGAVDFDDLLAFAARLFLDHADLLARYRERFRHILVDEYQDTNGAQHRLIALLAGESGNVFAVGDDDQSIYRWRGAEAENILHFERAFPGARVFRLEENYRSTARILAAAGALVAANRGRRRKELFTRREHGQPVLFRTLPDEGSEAAYIAGEVKRLRREEGVRWGEMAVLYRTNPQARPFEETFRRAGVPHRVVKGQRFFERAEVQDLAAYLRLAAGGENDLSFSRVLNVPPRGVGPRARERIEAHGLSQENGAGKPSLEKAARMALEAGALAGRGREGVKALLDLLDSLREEAKRAGPAALLEKVLDGGGSGRWLRGGSAEEDEGGRTPGDEGAGGAGGGEVAESFLALAREWEERELTEGPLPEGERPPASRFLEEMALAGEGDLDEGAEDEGEVSFLTLHAAKGLEFRAVFIAGAEEGLLPHLRSGDDPEELAEERRLFYVGMTRARDRLTITAARERLLPGGGRRRRYPSPFLEDIPPGLLERGEEGEGAPARRFAAREGERGVPSPAPGPFPPGMQVRHPRFGPGVIRGRSGEGDSLIVTVDFGRMGTKKLLVKYAGLEPSDGVDPRVGSPL